MQTIMRIIILTIISVFLLTNILGQAENTNPKIAHLTREFFIYSTYNTYQGNQVPANGMYLVTNIGIVMFDTPWDKTQFQPLLDSIKLNICIYAEESPEKMPQTKLYFHSTQRLEKYTFIEAFVKDGKRT